MDYTIILADGAASYNLQWQLHRFIPWCKVSARGLKRAWFALPDLINYAVGAGEQAQSH